MWGVWIGDLRVLPCTRQPQGQPCWCVLSENCRQGMFNWVRLLYWLPHSQIAENQPGTLLVTIDSKKLSANIESPSLIVQQHSDGMSLTLSKDKVCLYYMQQFSGKWRPRDKTQIRLEHDEVTLACASALVHKKIYRSNNLVLLCLFFLLLPPPGTWWTLILIWMICLW